VECFQSDIVQLSSLVAQAHTTHSIWHWMN